MIHYPDRFHMTPEQSLFLAKKKWDENVYCGMRMENRNITFPHTKTILQGVNVPSVQLDDIQAVLNMRDAWRFLLATMAEPLRRSYQLFYYYALRLHKFVFGGSSTDIYYLRSELLKFLKFQRTIVKSGRKTETIIHQ